MSILMPKMEFTVNFLQIVSIHPGTQVVSIGFFLSQIVRFRTMECLCIFYNCVKVPCFVRAKKEENTVL